MAMCFIFMYCSSAHAHKLGEGYVFLNIHDNQIEGRVEATLSDLDDALGLDTSGDGKVSKDELTAQEVKVHEYIKSVIQIGDQDGAYEMVLSGHEVLDTAIGPYGVVQYVIELPKGVPDVIYTQYDMLFDADSQHRGLCIIEWNEKTKQQVDGKTAAGIFTPDSKRIELDLTVHIYKSTFLAFLKHGIWHIWIGIDHILFLLAFVLQAVVLLQDRKWVPVEGFKPALWSAVKIVTLFTIAHSVTLSLAALGFVNLPSRLVESIIAASVVFAAINAIYPMVGSHIGPVIFGFGLFHGFGFATVLGHLGLSDTNLVVPLVAFNVGVEIGQVVVVLLTLPLCYVLSRSKAYPETTLRCLASIIAFIAFMWLIERAFDLEPLLEI